MCTVAFIPGVESYHFASLRDEDPQRARAIAPSVIYCSNSKYIAPVDPVGNGTWVGVNESGTAIILLNGGFNNHQKKRAYAKSRGKIVSDLLVEAMPVIEWNLMDLENIEPFTLIVWTDDKLFQLVWDGDQKHRLNLPKDKVHIWSSSTLYDDHAKNHRQQLFTQWIKEKQPVTQLSVLKFFQSYTDNNNGFIMKRHERIQTLSYTFITVTQEKTAMYYRDFSTGNSHNATIALLPSTQYCHGLNSAK